MIATELVARLPLNQLGGARVFRPCNIAGQLRKSGDTLDAETLAAMPKAALRALVDQRFIVPWPKSPLPQDGDDEILIYNRLGTSTYDVVLGKKLNATPLTKVDAEALATKHRTPKAA